MGPLLVTEFAGLAVSSSLPVVLDSTRLQSRSAMWPGLSLSHLGHPTARRHHPSLESDRSSIGDLLGARAAAAAVTDLARVTLTGSRPVDLIHPSAVWLLAYRLFVLCLAPPTLTTRRVGSEKAIPVRRPSYLTLARSGKLVLTVPPRIATPYRGLESLADPFLFSSFLLPLVVLPFLSRTKSEHAVEGLAGIGNRVLRLRTYIKSEVLASGYLYRANEVR